MYYLYLFGFFLGITIVQTSLFTPVSWAGVRPDFFLLLVIYSNLYSSGSKGLWSGFLGGLLEDILSGGVLGAATVSKTFSGCGTLVLGNKVVLDNPLVQMLLVLVVSLCEATLHLALNRNISMELTTFWSFILPQALITALVAAPFFWLMDRGWRCFSKN